MHEVLKEAKLTQGNKSQNIFATLGVEMSIFWEKACEAFLGFWNVL